MNKKAFFISFILTNCAVLVLLMISLIIHLLIFSYTRQSISNMMLSQNVANSREYQGIIVYVIGLDNGYAVYQFSDGVFRSRFRLRYRWEYEYTFHELAWSMRNRYFLHLIIRGDDILLNPGGRRSRNFGVLWWVNKTLLYINITRIFYGVVKKKYLLPEA